MEDAAAGEGDVQDDGAAIERVGPSRDPTGLFTACGELDCTVVAEREALGEVTYCGGGSGLRAGDLEEHLVLLGREAGAVGGFLREVQKTAENVTELGQGAGALGAIEAGSGWRNGRAGGAGYEPIEEVGSHIYIVTR